MNIFHHLQILFLRSLTFNYFNSKQQLYIDVDTSKEFDFDVHIYHSKSDLLKTSSDDFFLSEQKEMKSNYFLSCFLSNAETHYWFTKLKVADIVWMIKKIYHMIKTIKKITIIYTDHSAAVFIICQLSFNIVNIKKLNLHFI